MSLTKEQIDAGMCTGYFGCSCHPFPNWKECDRAHKQVFKIDDTVRNRCKGTIGIVWAVDQENKGFVIVKYGDLPRDRHLEHVAQIELIPADQEAVPA